jgi:hypothetical protein
MHHFVVSGVAWISVLVLLEAKKCFDGAEDTLWSGGPSDWNNPKCLETLPIVRQLVMDGKYGEATSEATKMLGPDPQVHFWTSIILNQFLNL